MRYLVIEGLMGAGKTTLCRLLAETWGARLVLEPADTNPFLASYYSDPVRYALPAQLFYLVTRWRQQNEIAQGDLFSDVVVADYLFAKDRLFAEQTLPPLELELYDRLAGALGESVPYPDLIVWLDSPTQVLLRRIAERRSPGEDAISARYVDDLRSRYERLWSKWTGCPILRLDNRDMDYRSDPVARGAVLDRIEAALSGKGLESPGSVVDREEQPSLFGPGPNPS